MDSPRCVSALEGYLETLHTHYEVRPENYGLKVFPTPSRNLVSGEMLI